MRWITELAGWAAPQGAIVRVVGLCAALAALPAGSADAPPDVLVKNVTLEVMDIVSKDAEILAGDRRKTIALVEDKVLPHFNFERMTALAMSTNWDKASPEQKRQLINEFRTLLVRTYASSIAAYRTRRFDFRPLRANPADTDVTVNVRVLQPGAQPVLIEYDMEKTARGWKVWDLRVAGISLVLNYRTEFANIARDSGVDGVLKSLTAKNASLEEASRPEAKK